MVDFCKKICEHPVTFENNISYDRINKKKEINLLYGNWSQKKKMNSNSF